MLNKKIVILFFLVICSFIILGCISTKSNLPINNYSQVIKSTFYSRSLKSKMKFNIYLPKEYNKHTRYPVLYLLHGYTNNEDCWMPDLKLKATADRLIENKTIEPLIIVMPQIDNSFGINADKIKNFSYSFSVGMYEDYLYKDLIPYIDKKYYTLNDKNHRYIGGLSMGGFAALHLAFIHTDLFSKVGGHSPAFIDDNWLYPNIDIKKERDPIQIAQNKDLGPIRVYLDCGNKDSFKFYIGCEKLFEVLKTNGIDVEYHLNNGEHNAEYWISNSEKYLIFYAGK